MRSSRKRLDAGGTNPRYDEHAPARATPPAVAGIVALQAAAGNTAVTRAVAPVVQRVARWAGYNRRATGRGDDLLVTQGLANCIAVVAYHRETRTAVLAHYDTLNAADGNRFRAGPLKALRDLLTAELAAAAGLARVDPEFHLGMGSIWVDVDPDDEAWEMRHDLLTVLTAVFGTEPRRCGWQIQFDVQRGKMGGSLQPMLVPRRGFVRGAVAAPVEAPKGWGDSGTEIPYAELAERADAAEARRRQ